MPLAEAPGQHQRIAELDHLPEAVDVLAQPLVLRQVPDVGGYLRIRHVSSDALFGSDDLVDVLHVGHQGIEQFSGGVLVVGFGDPGIAQPHRECRRKLLPWRSV